MHFTVRAAAKVVAKKAKKDVAKVVHPPYYKCTIKSQMATAAPPLGPSLGQRNINVQNFIKDFNGRTEDIRPGIPLPCRILVHPDRTYDLDIYTPTTSWLLLKAAGAKRGSERGMGPNREIIGKLSVKHIYHIAELKSTDKAMRGMPLEKICNHLVGTAYRLGIQIQYEDLDPVEYKKFLIERDARVERQLEYWRDQRTKKLLKTETTEAAATPATT